MQQSAGGGTNSDSHGDAVASAARTCPHGAGGVHGQCVSAVARTGDQESQTESSDAAEAAKVKACKASAAAADSSETAPAKGDKAAKSADQIEDKAEHQAFAACVSGS